MALSTEMATWMRAQVASANAQGIVVGLSGGIDSAVVARVAQLAVGSKNMLAVLMPVHSTPSDEADAHLVATTFGLPRMVINLGLTYDTLCDQIRSACGDLNRMACANLKPRLRMATLYALANQRNFLVAGTGNRSEAEMGYFTKYGDGGVDILPLASLVKSQVRQLAREIGVPQPIIDKAPSAGLWFGQTDEDEMGFTYDELERFIIAGPSHVDPPIAEKMMAMNRTSAHKRAMPPIFVPPEGVV